MRITNTNYSLTSPNMSQKNNPNFGKLEMDIAKIGELDSYAAQKIKFNELDLEKLSKGLLVTFTSKLEAGIKKIIVSIRSENPSTKAGRSIIVPDQPIETKPGFIDEIKQTIETFGGMVRSN